MLSQASDSGRRIGGHIMTLFLFTKSDFLTTLLPVVSVSRISCMFPDMTLLDLVCLGECSPSPRNPHSGYHTVDMDPCPEIRHI
jgi:hypothetical protein